MRSRRNFSEECLCPWSVLNSGQPGASHRVERSEIQELRDCESGIQTLLR